MLVDDVHLHQMLVKSERHEEASVLVGELARVRAVEHDPGGVELREVGHTQTRRNAVVEQRPAGHVGWYVNVRQVHCRVPKQTGQYAESWYINER